MPASSRRLIAASACCAASCAMLLAAAGCGAGHHAAAAAPPRGSAPAGGKSAPTPAASQQPASTAAGSAASATATRPVEPAGQFSIAFAGDVHFAGRTATRLATDPATAFGVAAPVLAAADLSMVNLETAIAVTGQPENKSFTFKAPPSAFTALADAGVDVATMANNHGADYGSGGLSQTLAAIGHTHFPVVGIGQSATAAYAPYYRTVNGVRIAIVAASQVTDETLAHFTATDTSPGIASAFSNRLVASVRAARARADVVIAYIHWGTEYQSCPNPDQRTLADTLTAAGASAVVGTHAHVLQGAGWRPDGRYVAYGLGNYLWWRSFGNAQDDNGVLKLTFAAGRVRTASFVPSQLDDQGVPVPASGANASRIEAEFDRGRQCAGLLAQPPR